jgi:hypothetical protein
MRTALLQWFATVKDSRGMPWRKPSDFSQTPEERSQRAYEVMRMLILISDGILPMAGVGIRSYAATNSGRNGHTLLQSLDGNVRFLQRKTTVLFSAS